MNILLLFYLTKINFLHTFISRNDSEINLKNYQHTNVDVTDEKQVRLWIREVSKRHNIIDALVCNAGDVKASTMVSVTSTKSFEIL